MVNSNSQKKAPTEAGAKKAPANLGQAHSRGSRAGDCRSTSRPYPSLYPHQRQPKESPDRSRGSLWIATVELSTERLKSTAIPSC